MAAAALAKMGSTRSKVPPRVFVQDLIKPSIKIASEEEEVAMPAPTPHRDGLNDVLMVEPEPD